ncbi:MAG: TIGR03016 family PEP-CTERM system-associated outer membrane protein [Thermodesulfovibrionales bacterium]
MRHIIPSFIALLLLVSAASAEGAEFRITPSFALSEEYTDNIFLESRDEQEEYITSLRPSITLFYEDAPWRWDVAYLMDYLIYARNTRGDELLHDLAANGHITVVRDFFFVDVHDRFERVSLDPARDFTRESLFLNQSDRNLFRINPYFVLEPGRLTTLTVGYRFSDTWYEEETAIDRTDNSAYSELALEVSPRTKAYVRYEFMDEDNDAVDFQRHDARAGARYEYTEESFIFGEAGNTWLDFDDGRSLNKPVWRAGLSRAFAYVTVTVETGREYEENPEGSVLKVDRYEASLESPLGRATLRLAARLGEYSIAETDALETRTYGGGLDVGYELSARAKAHLDASLDKLERKFSSDDPLIFLGGVRVEYLVLEDVTASLAYRYAQSDTKTGFDEYDNNRAVLELRAAF